MPFRVVFGWSIISHFHGNGVLHLLHFKYINTSQYPLVEHTGAVLIIPSSTWKLKLLADGKSFILLYRHSGIKDLDRKCQIKTQQTGKLAGE